MFIGTFVQRSGAVELPAVGVMLIALTLWATDAIPGYLTALVFFLLSMLFAVAPADVVFAGFHSTAVWLVFGGLVIAASVQESGLGTRLVRIMLAHSPRTYLGLLATIAVVGAGLAFLIPASSGRIVLYVPLVVELAERLGFDASRNGHTGLVLAAALGTLVPAFAILPSNVPNMILVGAAETILGVSFTYGEYLLLNYTVMGLLSLVAIILVVRAVFPDRVLHESVSAGHGRPTWSWRERRLLLILLAALGMWMSDFAHGLSPAWVALTAALLCLLPRIGVLPPGAVVNKINFGPWLFAAGIIGLGSVATHAGIGEAMSEAVLHRLSLVPGESPFNFGAVVLLGAVTAMVTTLPTMPAILTPLAQQIAVMTGWSVESVLMAQVPAWFFFPFPYEAPPLVIGMALAGLRTGDVVRCLLALTAVGWIVILPLQYLWGHALGYYG